MSFSFRKVNFLYISIPVVLALVFFSLVNRNFRRAPWYEELLWNVLIPPQHFFNSISNSVGGIWSGYIALVNVRNENEQLKVRVYELEQENVRGKETDAENERLKSLLGYHEQFHKKTVTASVISNDLRPEYRSAIIDKGLNDGIAPLMAVVGPRGLVGKISRVTANNSLVVFITDPNSAVDGLISRTRERGLVVGAAWHVGFKAGYYLTRMEYLSSLSDVKDNDEVVTSGLDGVFPAGVPIGTLQDIKTSDNGVFREAIIVPHENMAELAEVMVVMNEPSL